MFWRVSGLNTGSPVDSILDKESYSLEELLDEDELIQECKSLNARLTAYLKQKDTVEKLVRYLVEEPPPGADPKRSFKYPFTACEVFCCEVEGIFNTLLEHEELLDRLFSLLEAPRPLNCMLAGYFSRLMGSLLLRRTQEVMQYLQRHQALLPRLVHHCDTTSVAEVLVRLVGADEQRTFLPTNHLQWLSDTDLLYQLLDRLQPGQPTEAQGNAAEVLAALAQSQSSPLTKNLADPAFLELLVQRALRRPAGLAGPATQGGDAGAAEGSPQAGVEATAGAGEEAGAAAAAGEEAKPSGDSAAPGPQAAGDSGDEDGGAASSAAMVHALNVCIALVEPLPPSPAEVQAAAGGLGLGSPVVQAVDAAAAEVHAAMRAQATRCVAASIDALVALLEAPDPGRVLPTSYGLLRPPVGLARLKAAELLAALLHSGDEAAEAAVMGTRGVQRCLELFLAAPFNNVLHRHVAALVGALGGGSPRLAAFLLEDCRLLSWLVEAPLEVTPPPRPDSSEDAPRRPLRAGYAGHITLMCNRLLQLAAEGHPQLRAAMDADPAWQAYVHEQLQPRNAREDVNAWQCGRPTAHEPVVDGEGELFPAELEFGPGEGEAFTRDVYQRYGVFAPAEDEEGADAEQPQWALELANAASAAGAGAAQPGGAAPGVPPQLGKLPVPGFDGPQPFPVYDSASSSGSSSGGDSDDENMPRRGGSSGSSDEGEASVAPAAEDGGGAAPARGVGGGGAPVRLPLGSDDADMADDAVMLEYDAAEQLVSLGQLSLEERDGGDGGDGGTSAGNGAAAEGAHGEQRGGDGGQQPQDEAAGTASSPGGVDEAAGSPLKGGASQPGGVTRGRAAAAVGT